MLHVCVDAWALCVHVQSTVSVSVSVLLPYPCTPAPMPPQWMMPSWPLRSLCYSEACRVFNELFLSAGATHAAWPGLPLPSFLYSPETAERLIPPTLPLSLPTFFFSFFSSFFVKRVCTHQILVNMLPYARLKPRPRSHRRNWRTGEEEGKERGEEKGEMMWERGQNFNCKTSLFKVVGLVSVVVGHNDVKKKK